MSLVVTLNFPPELEKRVREQNPNLEAQVQEAVAIDLYRRGTLTHAQLAKVLDRDRFQTDELLKEHGVSLKMSESEFLEEVSSLRDLGGLLSK